MSSGSEYADAEAAHESVSDTESVASTAASSRRQSRNPQSPRKRRRLESNHSTRIYGSELDAKYNDDYRLLLNEEISRAAKRFEVNDAVRHISTQIGTSKWSTEEQALFFAALDRLGRDDCRGIASVIGTKSESETRDFLLVLRDAAVKQSNLRLTLRDMPAAIEIGTECDQRLDEMSDALAWYQESLEACQEQKRYGDFWLITREIAEEIEDAVNGVVRPSRASTADAVESARRGRGIAGACVSCKKRKLNCNREIPCSNCIKSQVDCKYQKNTPSDTRLGNVNDIETKTTMPVLNSANDAESDHAILRNIPEANLIQAHAMLKLSRNLFMNRSPDIPSPWLHWSEYTTGFASEPSIYRTAFNDLHDLVITVTRRLVQTTIAQTISRIRAQRVRGQDKGLLPRVKRWDVYTAVEVLGLRHNGNERWAGVHRRCGLRVYSRSNSTGKRKREVSWDEVEKIMSVASPERFDITSGPESPTKVENFQVRAMRSGTPLPLEDLALSDSDDDFQSHQVSEAELDAHFIQGPQQKPVVQARDYAGRYASVASGRSGDHYQDNLLTLESFDQEARQQEERALLDMLEHDQSIKRPANKDIDQLEHGYNEANEKIITEPDDWHNHIHYRNEWEELSSPLPVVNIIENRKPLSPCPDAADYGTDTRRSSHSEIDHQVNFPREGTELQMHGTNAYAALQNRGFEDSQDQSSGESEEDDFADIPTQSIEIDFGEARPGNSASDMDWN